MSAETKINGIVFLEIKVCEKCVGAFRTGNGKRKSCYTCKPQEPGELDAPLQSPDDDPVKILFNDAQGLTFKFRQDLQDFIGQLMVLTFQGKIDPKMAKVYKDLALAQSSILRATRGPRNRNAPPEDTPPEEELSPEDLALAEKAGYAPDGSPAPAKRTRKPPEKAPESRYFGKAPGTERT